MLVNSAGRQHSGGILAGCRPFSFTTTDAVRQQILEVLCVLMWQALRQDRKLPRRDESLAECDFVRATELTPLMRLHRIRRDAELPAPLLDEPLTRGMRHLDPTARPAGVR